MPRWRKTLSILILFCAAHFILPQPIQAQADEDQPVVHAVLFYSPACPHCQKVITGDFPPLLEKYGQQLLIVGVNTQTIEGQELYQAMIGYYELPPERRGVPALVVGETVLLGANEIPDLFPGMIEKGLQEGGIPWPPIPGFIETYTASVAQATAQAEATNQAQATRTTEPTGTETHQPTATNPPAQFTSTQKAIPQAEDSNQAEPTPVEMALPDARTINIEDSERQSMTEKFKRDPAGNTASVVVLAAMILSLGGVWMHLKHPVISLDERGRWIIPALCVVGLIVAGYLSYVEANQIEAVCGPVGDCNTVQQSPYARLFGVLPIGVLGLVGYVAILTAWVIQFYGPDRWQESASLIVWGLALIGTLFSIYLTFLEPFVIGATCAWCLTSAIIITLILWTATTSLRFKKSP
ncbi:MAG: vitamin K epoxide reductase family protein [Chloroflexi bacterium]|nr:vitamin K epoxide reductase family protein [Chloroflexota bacterium]